MSYDRSLALFDKARKLMPGGSQTTSKRPVAFAYGAYPIYVDKSEGCRVTDVDGNTFIDLVSALGPIVLGYSYPAVNQAVAEQLERGIISGLLFPVEVEAAELVAELVPSAEMVRFFKGGGDATAAAARIARAYTGRQLILNCGYRGWPDVWSIAHPDPGVPKGLEGSVVTFPFNDLDALKKLLEANKGQVAAVFLDVLRTEPEPGYLQGLIDLAHEHGALVAFDEIVTGFRLAKGGAQDHFGVKPDLACFAKGMANGMPVSAVVGRRDVMQTAEKLMMSITYGGEALSLAGAIATMKIIRDEPVTEHLWRIGQRLIDELTAAAAKHAIPFESVGIAPLGLMQFNDLDAQENELVWSYFLQEMATRGVLMRRGGVNFVTYSHSDADVDQIVAAADDVFGNLKPLWKTSSLAEQVKVKDVDTGFRRF